MSLDCAGSVFCTGAVLDQCTGKSEITTTVHLILDSRGGGVDEEVKEANIVLAYYPINAVSMWIALDMKYKKLSVTMAVPILCRGCIGCPLSFGKVISDGILHRFSSVNCPLLWVMLWPSKYFPIHESIPFARECGKGWRSGWCWQGNLIETRLHMRDIKFAFTVKLIRKIRMNGIWINRHAIYC